MSSINPQHYQKNIQPVPTNKRKRLIDDGEFEKKIELADLLLTAEKENKKKQRITMIGTFVDPELEKEKRLKDEYKTFTTWKNFLSKMQGELVRRKLVSDSSKSNKSWKQTNQEYLMEKLQKMNSGKGDSEYN